MTAPRLTTRRNAANVDAWRVALGGLGTTVRKVTTSGAMAAELLGGISWSPSYGFMDGDQADQIVDLARARLIDAVVYSYDTPIAFRVAGAWVLPDARYSRTTSGHQSLLREALGIGWSTTDQLRGLLAAAFGLEGEAADVLEELRSDWDGTVLELVAAATGLAEMRAEARAWLHEELATQVDASDLVAA
jgi:hypothetical protein